MVLVDYEAFLKNVYTVSFRLTGEVEIASDLTLLSLTRTAKEFGWHPTKPISSNMPFPVLLRFLGLFSLSQNFGLGRILNPFLTYFKVVRKKKC